MQQSVWGFRKAAEIVRENRKDALILSVTSQPHWYWTFWDPTRAYYNFMQRLNFTYLDRTYDVYMGFGVAQLEQAVLNSGADKPPTIDVKGLIDRIGERTAFVGMKPVGR
jgi:hypothetical protein